MIYFGGRSAQSALLRNQKIIEPDFEVPVIEGCSSDAAKAGGKVRVGCFAKQYVVYMKAQCISRTIGPEMIGLSTPMDRVTWPPCL